MAPTTPPTSTDAPTDIPDRSDIQTFDPRVDGFVTWEALWQTEVGPIATNVYNNAVIAYDAGVIATAALSAPATPGNSTDTRTIATGTLSMTIETGKNIIGGMYAVIADAAAPSTNSMFAQVTSYTTGTGAIVFDVLNIKGSGSKSVWTISLNGFNAAAVINVGDRNLIINGDMRINQEAYVSAATLASGDYGHDQFKAGASGGDYSFTQLKSSTELTIVGGKSLIQMIEDVNVGGGDYIASWEGTAVGRVGVDSGTPSGVFAVSPILLSSQTAGTICSIEFAGAAAVGTSSVTSATTGTLGKVQLELGALVTQFERKSITKEFSACTRLFEIGVSAIRGVAGAGGENMASSNTFQNSKRVIPTMTSITASNLNITTSTLDQATKEGFRHQISSTASGSFYSLSNIWTADARL